MRHVAKPIPTKPLRRSMGTDPALSDEVSPQANENEGDISLDNDLGAEWMGNIDCEEGAKNKPKRGSGACETG